jgi:protein gp37
MGVSGPTLRQEVRAPMAQWNPWHGCRKISAGCQNCYVYRIDAIYGRDPTTVAKTAEFDLPVRRGRGGHYRLLPGECVHTCFSSDFFLDEADAWRVVAWRMIRERDDLDFFIVTKRIDRFRVNLPSDWGDGYGNVTICSTCENQDRAAHRLPLLLEAPIRHREILCEPLLERIDLTPWLSPAIAHVTVGGESGREARVCDYDWVKDLQAQCVAKRVAFHFKQTGARFVKDGRLYCIERKDQMAQAAKAGLDWP